MWILTESLAGLRLAFNLRFPNRDRTSDGTIGDASHATRASGHNPDDTAGVTAEFTDADTVAEVRAIDVDSDLRDLAVTMRDVIAAILATPADRDRLAYIIFDRTIWSARSSWQPRAYDGPSPHTGHAHFSGSPAADASTAPWVSVLTTGGNMGQLDDIHYTLLQAIDDTDGDGRIPHHVWASRTTATLAQLVAQVDLLRPQLDQLAAQVASLSTGVAQLHARLDQLGAGVVADHEHVPGGVARAG